VSEFFEPEAPVPHAAPTIYRAPWWRGPAFGMLAGSVAIDLVLAKTSDVAVCVTGFQAFSTGFFLDLVTISAYPGDRDLDPMFFEAGQLAQAGDLGPATKLRFGVQFADGAKATNVARAQPVAPTAPVMHIGGGGGGGGRWRQEIWISPLPPAGPLLLACEWPAAGIEPTTVEIDARLIIAGAQRAQVVFAHEHLPEWPA
jgi:hypothetical protein